MKYIIYIKFSYVNVIQFIVRAFERKEKQYPKPNTLNSAVKFTYCVLYHDVDIRNNMFNMEMLIHNPNITMCISCIVREAASRKSQ